MVSVRCAHAAPPCDDGVSMVRERVLVPMAHETVHVVQETQLPTMQLTGHDAVPQGRVSVSAGHAAPPFCTCVKIERVRLCTPVPQDFVHSDHVLKVLATQSTGHAPRLHDCVSDECGHAAPPNATAVAMARLRDCVPSPHE